jgi:phage-related protein
MALTTSIKINGIDIRAAYGVEILSKQGFGNPPFGKSLTAYSNKAGGFQGNSYYQPRTIKLSGEIRAADHDTLITYIEYLKDLLYAGPDGKRNLIIEFGDETDRYYKASVISNDIVMAPPILTSCYSTIEIALSIDESFAAINDFVLQQIPGSPITSPFSGALAYDGTAESRPRIVCENIESTGIASLKLLSMCSRQVKKSISVTTTGLKRGTGAFGDSKGAAWFDNAGSSYFASYANFNSFCFTVMSLIKLDNGQTNPGYLFSTAGDVIRCYYDTGNEKWIFAIDSDTCEILDSESGFGPDNWFWICCEYNPGGMMGLYMANYASTPGTIVADYYSSGGHHATPTNFYIGTNASLASPGYKYLDEFRVYCYPISSKYPSGQPTGTNYMSGKFVLPYPAPLDTGLSAYFPFDYKANGVGWQNNELILTNALAQNEIDEIDCERMTVYELGAAITASPTAIMSSVAGEFPILAPIHGVCPIQIVHDGAASGLRVSIEKKERYL